MKTPGPEKEISGPLFARFLQLIKLHTGITLQEHKKDLLVNRLRPRLRELGLATFEEYANLLEPGRPELQVFINRITTNETMFFRTPLIWRFFTGEFLKQWQAKKLQRPLRIWSAASSSGEEAYSIAMACEDFRKLHPGFQYRIWGSDISTDVLERARAGRYSGRSIQDLKAKKPGYLETYFKPEGDVFVISGDIKKNVEFSSHNLHAKPPRPDHYDIVFLRNVLIYFNEADQEKVLRNVLASLLPGGCLVLGESESLSRLKTDFIYKEPLIYFRGQAA